MKLLTIGNTKTVKGQKKGYMTFILHLAPSNLSGYNVCPMASKGCRDACLNTAGRGRFDNTQAARVRKTRMFFEERQSFMEQLVSDIRAGIRKADRDGYIPVFRLNGTSDIRWENIPVLDPDRPWAGVANVMALFPNVQFYDYTALPNRRNIPANYHLTFSRKENNDFNVYRALAGNTNIAVVFDVFPDTYMGRTVISGDEDDLRFLDPKGVVIGLKAKGQAKKDDSGFVVLTKRVA